MKILKLILLSMVFFLNSCGSNKTKSQTSNAERMEFTITKIQNEKDGQTLFLKDEKGVEFTTVISIPNGNFVEVEKGNRISLVAKEILEMHPAIIVSEDIKVITKKIATQTKIITNKSIYKIDEPIELSMEIKNTADTPFTFLPWGTPLENSFTRGCLQVIHNNEKVPYTGIMVKRVAPADKDYITLKKDETYSGKVNVLEGYKLTKKGKYSIQFEETYNGMPASNIITITIE